MTPEEEAFYAAAASTPAPVTPEQALWLLVALVCVIVLAYLNIID